MSDNKLNEEMNNNEKTQGRKTKKKSEKTSDKFTSSDFSFLTKIFSPIKILIKLHLRIAKKELKKDLFRYITGIIFLIIAFFTVIIMFILSNILIILIFKYFIFNYFKNLLDYIFSIFATVIINFSFFLIIIISAFINFKKPFLKETKKAIKETLNDLK